MATKQPKKRKLVRSLLWLTTAGILLLVLLPLWFPWVAAPVAGRYGLGFAEYDRIGWTRFAVKGVQGAWNGTRLDVGRVESVLPTTWLWRRFHDRSQDSPLLSLSDGQLWIAGPMTNTNTSAKPAAPGSTSGVLNHISQIGRRLKRFLPVADLTNCTVQIVSNRVSIPEAHWRAGALRALVRVPSARGEIELAGRLDGDSGLGISVDWKEYDASLRGGFSRTNQGWRWDGELNWLTNRANLSAQFTANGWWPVRGQVECQKWRIPASFLPVKDYENLIATLTANLASNRFELQATGLAHPTPASAQQGFPVVDFLLGADGDPNEVKVNTLNIQSPLLRAALTNTVSLNWRGELISAPAQVRVSTDLGKLPGVTLTGQVDGVVRIEPQGGRSPVVQFLFSGGPVSAGQLEAKTVLVRGEFAAPIITLKEMRADFADGSVLVADGSFNGEARRIAGGRWHATGGFLQRLLSGLSYAELAASGEFQGALTNLSHRGEISLATCRVAGLKPFCLRASWSGQHQHIAATDFEWTAGDSVLSVRGVADLDVPKREVAATLNKLTFRRDKEELYTLQQPCGITFHAGKTNAPGPLWTLGVDAFNWRSERHAISGTADLAWPSSGKATLTMTNIACADFSDVLEANVTNMVLAELAATAHWSNGPVHSEISVAGSLTNSAGREFALRGKVKTDESLIIEQLAVESDHMPGLSVTGTIPIKIILERGKDLLVKDGSQNINLAGNWRDDRTETYTIPLGTRGQLEVSQPEVVFQVSGTPDAPSAELTAVATKLVWQSKTNNSPRPKLEDLQLAVEIGPNAIRLKAFAAKLDGQAITATGEWPILEQSWRELWSEGKMPDWNEAQGRLDLAEAQLAAFSSYLPPVLLPEGRLSASLELKQGRRLEGVLSVTNVATRPMGTLTPLRDIAALVRLDGARAVLEDFRGQIGGQPIRADGFAVIPELKGNELNYLVNLHGTNVPLARSPELLLRGDFAVSLRGGSNVPPLLSGVVKLRDGLYVQYASALVLSAPKRPEWRPPFFSVTNAPFADWKLDVGIRGDRFLRVRAPVFSGIVSADFQLKGKLLAPVLTGDASINSGRLIFPFGSLAIDQGFASFSGNDARGPDLQINASGRNYRYDLRLEVKGPADGANVLFSSTPPLTSEQILLMLSAGDLPQSDFAFSSGARAGRLATFLGKDLLSRYTGSDPTKERLIIQTGESISQEGRLTYSVEYRLTDRWSIIGEYDEFNAFNTDLKWKIFTR